MDKMTMGVRIREQRKQLGMSQEQLAEKVNITSVYLSEIERGRKMPSVATLIRIVNKLEISADLLLRDTVDAAKPYVLNELAESMQDLTPAQLKLMRGIVDVIRHHVCAK